MTKEALILTRKIQLIIDSDDKETRAAYQRELFEWQNVVVRSSNLVMTHQYVQEHLKDFVYLQDDVKVKLTDRLKDSVGIFNTSRLNTTYKLLSHYFKGRAPSNILSNVNVVLNKSFNADRMAYWKGEKSLRNYRRGIPIPFSANQLKIKFNRKGEDFNVELFKIPFRTYLGKDNSDKKVLLQRVTEGQIKICASSLQISRSKIFLLLSLEIPKKEVRLHEHVIAEAFLSAEHPMTVSIDSMDFQIGNKEEFQHRRWAIQAARQRVQAGLKYHRGGKGRKRKFKSLDHYNQKERDYMASRLHLYSRKLIDICVASQAGTLRLVSPSNKRKIVDEDDPVLYNWGYYGLLEKIQYKAELVGIHVIVA